MHKTSNSWEIVSQDRSLFPLSVVRNAEKHYLPSLTRLWQAIEAETGYRWRCTSYWRKSPSHKTGSALDIAPDIADIDKPRYAVYKASDPTLYKVRKLLRSLQRVARRGIDSPYNLGIYIEPDHLHLQVMQTPPDEDPRIEVFKWKIPKPVYGDTLSRMKEPMR